MVCFPVLIDQSPKRRVLDSTFSLMSVLVIRLSSRSCLESRCSGFPVSPVRLLISVIAVAAVPKSVGTSLTTSLKSVFSPASALPVFPVPIWIVS